MSYLRELREIADEYHSTIKLRNFTKTVDKLKEERTLARRNKPLTEQISELMLTLPPQLRDRPWSMAELVARLTGKYRDRPHTQHVGMALMPIEHLLDRCPRNNDLNFAQPTMHSTNLFIFNSTFRAECRS